MLIEDLRFARRAKGLSRAEVAAATGLHPQTIKRLEAGVGTVPALTAVMRVLDLHLSGVARGSDLPSQLRQRRLNMRLTKAQVAEKTHISRATLVGLERGQGSVRSLVRVLEAIAPQARRQEPARAHWSPDAASERDVQFTPPEFMEAVYDAFGPVDLDPCAHEASPVLAARRILLSEGGDGLRDEWGGRLVYMNSPYSALLKWLRRADEQWGLGNVETVIALAPARMDSAWFHDHLRYAADIYVLKGRMRFLTIKGRGHQAPFTMMVVAWGASVGQKERWSEHVPEFWL